jgi:hypothetical protein
VAHRYFARPPFVVPFLAPGEYRVEGHVGGRRIDLPGVRVRAGEETVVEAPE